MKQLFMLRGDSMFPEVVSLPPTSLKAIRQFFLKLTTQGIPYYQCIVRIELEKAQNAAGQDVRQGGHEVRPQALAGRERARGRVPRVRGELRRRASRRAGAAAE